MADAKDHLRANLTAYAQGELSPAEAEEIRAWLDGSETARREFEEIQDLFKLCAELPAVEPSPAFEQRLVAAFSGEEAAGEEEPGWLRANLEALLMLPAFIRHQLAHSARVRALGLLTAAFAVHACVYTVFQLLERGDEAPAVAELPGDPEPIEIRPVFGGSPIPDGEHEPNAIPVSTPDPDFEIPEPERAEPVHVAADTEGLWIPTEALTAAGVDQVNLRTLTRLSLRRRYDADLREQELASHFGPGTAPRIELGLRWLVRQQSPDGSFDPSTHGGYAENAVGVTGLATLALLGNGNCSTYGPHEEAVRRAVDHLLSIQTPEGRFGGESRSLLYGQAMATLALLEDYVLRTPSRADARLQIALERSVSYLVRAQNSDGGWGYVPDSGKSDASSSCWQMHVLNEARRCGFAVEPAVRERFEAFLRPLMTSEGTVRYSPESDPAPTGGEANPKGSARLGAAALLTLLGSRAEVAEAQRAAHHAAMGSALEALEPDRKDYHLVFYGTSVRVLEHRAGTSGDGATPWTAAVRARLLSWQDSDGSFAPEGDPYGAAGGRLYATAMGLLTLESPFR